MNQALSRRPLDERTAYAMRAAAHAAVAGTRLMSIKRARTRDHAVPSMVSLPGGGSGIVLPANSPYFDAFPIMGNARGDARGRTLQHPYQTRMQVRDAANGNMVERVVTYDSTGAFLVGELERLDYTTHEPLVDVEYTRDVDMRTDVTIADELSSYTYSQFASAGGLGAGNGIRTGKAWISKEATQISSINVDIAKVAQPLRVWGLEAKYDILELESAARVGRPIDVQKINDLQLKHEMDVDEQVYVGDANFGDTGLFNAAGVANVSNLPNGAAASPLWSTKTPQEILADVSALIMSVWTASGFKAMPNRIMLPPAQYGYLATQIISSGAGNISILKFLLDNNVLNASGRGRLEILPSKWLIGAGVGGTIGTPGTVDRMVAYSKDYRFVRYPMTALQRTPIQYDGMWHKMIYFCRLGVLEIPYTITFGYRDGL